MEFVRKWKVVNFKMKAMYDVYSDMFTMNQVVLMQPIHLQKEEF